MRAPEGLGEARGVSVPFSFSVCFSTDHGKIEYGSYTELSRCLRARSGSALFFLGVRFFGRL